MENQSLSVLVFNLTCQNSVKNKTKNINDHLPRLASCSSGISTDVSGTLGVVDLARPAEKRNVNMENAYRMSVQCRMCMEGLFIL